MFVKNRLFIHVLFRVLIIIEHLVFDDDDVRSWPSILFGIKDFCCF